MSDLRHAAVVLRTDGPEGVAALEAGIRCEPYGTQMRGVDHYSLLCRLARFHDLMINAEYSAVIGRETRIFVCAQLQFPGYGFFLANHSAVFCVDPSNHGISPNDNSVHYSG